MAIRLSGRILMGSDLRAFNIAIKRAGLSKELRKAVLRGDSTASINRILSYGGYTLNRFQLGSYIGSRYTPTVSTAYFDKLKARFGNRSAMNVVALQRAGYQGNVQFTFRFKKKNGKFEFRTIQVDGTKYASITDLLKKLIEDLTEFGTSGEKYDDNTQVVSLTLR